jgi:hypothetical protein
MQQFKRTVSWASGLDFHGAEACAAKPTMPFHGRIDNVVRRQAVKAADGLDGVVQRVFAADLMTTDMFLGACNRMEARYASRAAPGMYGLELKPLASRFSATSPARRRRRRLAGAPACWTADDDGIGSGISQCHVLVNSLRSEG